MTMNEELLFVTKATNEWDDGFPYVLELAQTLKAEITVLRGHKQTTLKYLR